MGQYQKFLHGRSVARDIDKSPILRYPEQFLLLDNPPSPGGHVNPETIFGSIIVIVVIAFFAWMLWLTDEKHPERLIKLRKEWGVIDPPSDGQDPPER